MLTEIKWPAPKKTIGQTSANLRPSGRVSGNASRAPWSGVKVQQSHSVHMLRQVLGRSLPRLSAESYPYDDFVKGFTTGMALTLASCYSRQFMLLDFDL